MINVVIEHNRHSNPTGNSRLLTPQSLGLGTLAHGNPPHSEWWETVIIMCDITIPYEHHWTGLTCAWRGVVLRFQERVDHWRHEGWVPLELLGASELWETRQQRGKWGPTQLARLAFAFSCPARLRWMLFPATYLKIFFAIVNYSLRSDYWDCWGSAIPMQIY